MAKRIASFGFLLLWVSLLTAAEPGVHSLSNVEFCNAVIGRLVPFKKGDSRILAPGEVLLENKDVYPAVVAVLEAYRSAGLRPPAPGLLVKEPETDTAWKAHWRSLPVEIEAKVPLTKKLKGGTDPVYDVTIDGKRYVFREMDEYQDMRLSIAAAQLNEAIGIGTAPRLRVAKVNGKLGTLSDFVEGAKLPQLNRQTPLKRLLEAGTLNEESYFDAKAFEFLVGNTDAKCVDSFINPEGKVVCVDHNYAFRHGLVEYFPYEAALGPVLPSRYSAKWVAFVNETKRGGTNPTKRDAIIANLKIYLSPAEVDATLFRLEVIAADMDRKK